MQTSTVKEAEQATAQVLSSSLAAGLSVCMVWHDGQATAQVLSFSLAAGLSLCM
ncbi:unnamed protein product, partial [Closterium sp. NIES-54]